MSRYEYIVEWVIFTLLLLIAFGTIWTAYESHVANEGVHKWINEFSEIRQGGEDTPNSAPLDPAPHDQTKHDNPQYGL